MEKFERAQYLLSDYIRIFEKVHMYEGETFVYEHISLQEFLILFTLSGKSPQGTSVVSSFLCNETTLCNVSTIIYDVS